MLKILVHHLDGVYLDLKNPTGLAPLKALTNSVSDIEFLTTLIRSCIFSDGGRNLNSEEDRRLHQALRMIMELPPEDRWMEEVCAFLGVSADSVGKRLEKWCHGQELGGIIDCPKDLVRFDAPVIGFDKTFILSNKVACGAVMTTLYHYTDKLIEGNPIIFADDEVWASMENPVFAPMIANQLKARSRKGNAPTILLTQSPSDPPDALAATIREQCPTHVHFYSGNASWEDYKAIGRTKKEFEIIQNLQPATGEFLISQNRVSVRAQMPLTGLDDFIAVMSGRKSNIKLFNQLLTETDDPTELAEKFQTQRRLEVVP
jgi:type IV secretion system protein VirB4